MLPEAGASPIIALPGTSELGRGLLVELPLPSKPASRSVSESDWGIGVIWEGKRVASATMPGWLEVLGTSVIGISVPKPGLGCSSWKLKVEPIFPLSGGA